MSSQIPEGFVEYIQVMYINYFKFITVILFNLTSKISAPKCSQLLRNSALSKGCTLSQRSGLSLPLRFFIQQCFLHLLRLIHLQGFVTFILILTIQKKETYFLHYLCVCVFCIKFWETKQYFFQLG